MSRMRAALIAMAALSVAACSSQQLYNSAAGLRQQECNRMLNRDERERCLTSADRSHEEYEQRKKQ
jgi:hypothetical protein